VRARQVEVRALTNKKWIEPVEKPDVLVAQKQKTPSTAPNPTVTDQLTSML